MKKWWAANIIWLIVFASLTMLILFRKVDGAGAIQTPEVRLISLAVLGGFFLLIVIIQAMWGYFAYRKLKKQRRY